MAVGLGFPCLPFPALLSPLSPPALLLFAVCQVCRVSACLLAPVLRGCVCSGSAFSPVLEVCWFVVSGGLCRPLGPMPLGVFPPAAPLGGPSAPFLWRSLGLRVCKRTAPRDLLMRRAFYLSGPCWLVAGTDLAGGLRCQGLVVCVEAYISPMYTSGMALSAPGRPQRAGHA